jgi:3-hydroxyacyl-CoA dehydrogenase
MNSKIRGSTWQIPRFSLAADDVLHEGSLGRKVGPGFYDYGKVVS